MGTKRYELTDNQPVHFHDIKNEGNPAVLCQEKTSKTEWWYVAASEKQHQRAIYNHPLKIFLCNLFACNPPA